MQIPPGMMAQATVFCSFQPCTRVSDGELVTYDNDGNEVAVQVCERHAEYLLAYFGGGEIEDPDILSKEIVFLDDVHNDEMVEDIAQRDSCHEIIGE